MNIFENRFRYFGLLFALSFTVFNTHKSFALSSDDVNQDQIENQAQAQAQAQPQAQPQDANQSHSEDQNRSTEPAIALVSEKIESQSAEANFLNSLLGYYQGTRQQSDNTGSPTFTLNTYQNYVFPTVFTSDNRWTFRWVGCYQNGYCSNYDTILAEKNGKIYLDINGDGSVLIAGTTSEVTTNTLVQFFNYNINSTTTRNVIIFDNLSGDIYTRSIIIRDNGEIIRELFYVLVKSSSYTQKHEAAPHTRIRF